MVAAAEACSAFCATSCTVALIWFMAVATWSVSSRCWLMRSLVSSLLAANCVAACVRWPTPWSMPPISSRRLKVMSRMLDCNWPISSRRSTGSTWLRSPLLIRAATARVWRSGWVICRVISQPAITPTTSASMATLVSNERAARASLSRCSTLRSPSSTLTALNSSPIFSMLPCNCSTRTAARRY
ncbi:hypothetical protein D3C80_1376300 [compost metagenome]